MWHRRIVHHAAHHARETGKFLQRSYNTARKWAQTFDHVFDVGHRIASAVAPIVDEHAGTKLTRAVKSGADEYNMLRARVLGGHDYSRSVSNQVVGALKKSVPEIGL